MLDPLLRNRACRLINRAVEALRLRRRWLKELSDYYGGMSEEELWERYYKERGQKSALWGSRPRTSEEEYRSFYAETSYFVFRQMYYNRHQCYFDVMDALKGRRAPRICEYGCGVAPVTAWLIRRVSDVRFTLLDIPTPTLEFARWRFRERKNVEFLVPGLGDDLPLSGAYDVITCLDVLEHVINPLAVVKHLVAHLKPGGELFVNFIYNPTEDNLAEAAAQRGATIEFLNETLTARAALDPRSPEGGYGRYVKREGD